jgi:hypothetical protein
MIVNLNAFVFSTRLLVLVFRYGIKKSLIFQNTFSLKRLFFLDYKFAHRLFLWKLNLEAVTF